MVEAQLDRLFSCRNRPDNDERRHDKCGHYNDTTHSTKNTLSSHANLLKIILASLSPRVHVALGVTLTPL